MNNEPIKTDASEIGPDDSGVSRLLAALKRVEAPNDFDFRVKARIAAGQPATRRPFGLPAAVGYAIPLVLLVLIGAYFGLNAITANKQAAPIVAEAPNAGTAPQTALPSNAETVLHENSVPEERAGVKKQEAPVAAATGENPAKKVSVPAMPANRRGGGSMDQVQHIAPSPLLPRGFNTNGKSSNSSALDRNAQISPKEVLEMVGVKGSFSGAGWKVDAVAPESPAAHSGVKAGDVIEAIDDRPLTDKTSFKDAGSGKSLRVRRDGASIQIVLKH